MALTLLNDFSSCFSSTLLETVSFSVDKIECTLFFQINSFNVFKKIGAHLAISKL